MLISGWRGNKTPLLTSLDNTMKNIERITEIDSHLNELEGIAFAANEIFNR